jgi:hypothetical protein
MPQSPLRLIEMCAEYKSQDEIEELPRGLRGIYVLYKKLRKDKYDVVYVGMTATGYLSGIKGRLKRHRKKKPGLWTHFSLFKVWDNIRDDEVKELEGLFRHLYKYDSRANSLNKQKSFSIISKIRKNNLSDW